MHIIEALNPNKDCQSQHDLQPALSCYKLSANFDITYWTDYELLGDLFVNKRLWREAIWAYTIALKNQRDLNIIYRKLASAVQEEVQRDLELLLNYYSGRIPQNSEDITNYYKAIDLAPTRGELYLDLGKALARKGMLDAATNAYRKAVQLKPELAEVSQLKHLLAPLETVRSEGVVVANSSFNKSCKLERAKQVLETLNQIALDNFLDTGSTIRFPSIKQPRVSIILVLHNRAEMTLSCLSSILRNNFKSYEVILADNCSTDSTQQLLSRIQGAKIIHNSENLHFLLACNQASKLATGEFILFLNNDAQLLGDSITAAVETITSSENIGAVGGKITFPDGTLQEAGSIIWQDGCCSGYGRGDSPAAPQYMYQRAVDYCSAAFLLTPTELFLKLGGFDEDYIPAYCEEIDYCVRLWKLGKKVIYDPKVTLIHYEFASSSHSSSSAHAIALMQRNYKILQQKHQDWLQHQYPSEQKNILFARTNPRDNRLRLLYIDNRAPHPYLDSGCAYNHRILSTLVELRYAVTLYLTDLNYTEKWTDIYADISREVEVMRGYGLLQLEEFLRERKEYYDIVLVTDPYSIKYLKDILSRENLLAGAKVVFEAKAIDRLREFNLN